MSLRLKLFLVFGGLMAAVVLAQWLLIRSLNRDIYLRVGETATQVGRGMASILVFDTLNNGASHTEGDTRAGQSQQLVHTETDQELVFVHQVPGHEKGTEATEVFINTEGALHKRIRRQVDQKGRVTVFEEISCKDCPEETRLKLLAKSEDAEGLHWIQVEGEPGAHSWKMIVPGRTVDAVAEQPGPEVETGATMVTAHQAPVTTTETLHEQTSEKGPVHAEFRAEKVVAGHKAMFGDLPFSGNVAIKLEADNLIFESDDLVQSISLPFSKVDEAIKRASNTMMAGSMLILLCGLTCGGYIAHRVSKPLADLSKAADQVGGGALGKTVTPPSGYPEISRAINAFNAMSLRLQELDEINRRNQQRRHLTELGEIARGFAHTIRNPLNTLGLSLEHMSLLSGGSRESLELAGGAQKQIQRIDQLIRSFLALASEGAGQAEALDISALIQDIVLEAVQNNPHGIELALEIEPQLPGLSGIAPELRSVIQALVINALEASPPGGQVLIKAQVAHGDGITIMVADQGPGLTDEVLQRLFTPHVTTKTYGSGMGLFLAHRLATGRYRGTLVIENADQGGAVATLTLPKDNEYGTHQNSAG